MARWDWYQSTVWGLEPEDVVEIVFGSFDLADLVPGRPKNGYHHGTTVRRGDAVLAEVWWGGNPGVHVKATGVHSPVVAEALRGLDHAPTRVDVCEDWVEVGLFDRISAKLIDFAHVSDLAVEQQGDWTRGKARTLYLGSKDSAVRLVLYEKGYQMGADHRWVRLEVRVRPRGHAKAAVSLWYPGEAFGASRWLVGALASIGWGHLQLRAVGTVRQPTDRDRQRGALLRQYGRIMREWATELGGWQHFGMAISGALDDQERKAADAADAADAAHSVQVI